MQAPNIYFIVWDNSTDRISGDVRGTGVGGKSWGEPTVTSGFTFGTAAHEFGHVFGLRHDFRDDTYIMSYGGSRRKQLSACAAEFLTVSPYFNPDIPLEEGTPPTIELISPRTYPVGSESVTIRLKVSDTDGVHQVFLLGVGGLIACRGLKGRKEAIIEFEYDGVASARGYIGLANAVSHSIGVYAVDTNRDMDFIDFQLAEVSQRHIHTLEGHTGRVGSLAFSPDGKKIASAGDSTVKLWDVATKRHMATFEGSVVAFSPDGRVLATGAPRTVKLWDIAGQRNIAILEEHGNGVRSMAFSSDGKMLASGGWDGIITLWDIATKRNIFTFEAHIEGMKGVPSVVFSPDGKMLASGGYDGIIALWDVVTGTNIASIPEGGLWPWVYSVAFSPDGTILASGQGNGPGNVKLWDVATKRNIAFFDHLLPVTSVAFSPDGQIIASGSRDGMVTLRHVATGAHITDLPHVFDVWSVAFSPDGKTLASGTEGGTVELWDMSGLSDLVTQLRSPVTISDANLRAKIAETLGKSRNTQLTAGDMLALTRLRAPDANIRDLTGLEHAHNLRELYLHGREVNSNAISDFTPLERLTNLRTLQLSDCSLSDIAFLAELPQLTYLNLSNNPISNVSALAGLTELDLLDLSGTSVSDISALSGLTQLFGLYISGTSVSDLSALSGLTQLNSLSLSSNEISDVSSLSGLTQLTYLDLSGNAISDISPLTGLTQLTSLHLSSNEISDISPLSDLTQLTDLSLNYNAILDVSPLIGLELPGTQWESTGLYIEQNPLNYASVHTHIPAMQAKGVEVRFDNRVHSALVKISGDTQEGEAGTALESPFVVEALDEHSVPITGLSVAFHIIEGNGRLRPTTTITDANGRAQTTLTLGGDPGVIKIRVIAARVTYPVTFTAIATEVSRLAADVNGDGIVNIQDLVLVASNLGQTGQSSADVNGDGIVNIQDLVRVAGALGQGTAAAPTLHASDLEGLTAADIQQMLTQARQLALTDPAYLRGIAVLEQLLALLLPNETALLANYPNPFNPETWIPYQLAKPSEVTLHIYAVNGRLVRVLVLGHQSAGRYQSRSRAAYWDGRNSLGEAVASGVYFYTLTAGDFTATRKMLIRK